MLSNNLYVLREGQGYYQHFRLSIKYPSAENNQSGHGHDVPHNIVPLTLLDAHCVWIPAPSTHSTLFSDIRTMVMRVRLQLSIPAQALNILPLVAVYYTYYTHTAMTYFLHARQAYGLS
jgi:hypothetical protein